MHVIRVYLSRRIFQTFPNFHTWYLVPLYIHIPALNLWMELRHTLSYWVGKHQVVIDRYFPAWAGHIRDIVMEFPKREILRIIRTCYCFRCDQLTNVVGAKRPSVFSVVSGLPVVGAKRLGKMRGLLVVGSEGSSILHRKHSQQGIFRVKCRSTHSSNI